MSKAKYNTKEKKCYSCGDSGHLSFQCKTKRFNVVECYKCGKKGHISKYCPEIKPLNNVKELKDEGIDVRRVRINGVEKEVVFDTGASINMLCKGTLKNIPEIKITPKKKDYYYFDGSKNSTMGVVDLYIEYEGRKLREEFNVVDENNYGNILLCNSVVKKLTEEIRPIPVECCFNTGNSDPVSWSRPIRNWKDKKDFELLIDDLEK
jgi:hypothetical protein